MTMKRSIHGFIACSLSVVLLGACGSEREKTESIGPSLEREAAPTPAKRSADLRAIDRGVSERAVRALEAIRVEAKLPELELKRLTPVAKTAAHAQSLIDKIEDPVARERARKDLELAVHGSLGSALSPEQVAIVHRHILASGKP